MSAFESLSRRLRDARGQSAAELAGTVPIIVMVVLLVIQGLMAMAALSDVRDAARDGARAEAAGTSVAGAVTRSLPEWIELGSISSCGNGCVRVSGRIPLGIPGVVEVTRVTISSSATFRVAEH